MGVNPFYKFLKPEDKLQISVCQYLRAQYPGVVIHHSPNEGKRSPFERFLFAILGVSPGFPDLLLMYRRRLIVIELKAVRKNGRSGTATPAQLDWLRLFHEANVPSACCWGFDEAKIFIDNYFAGLKS